MTVPGPDEPDYEAWFATVQDSIKYDVSGTPAPNPGPDEALIRLGQEGSGQIADLSGYDHVRLRAALAAAVERGESGELSLGEAAHAALIELRIAGLPVPPRPPDDPFPDLTL